MRGLDGIQGPVYVGTGCVFRRQALYGYEPPKGPKRPKMVVCGCCPCFGRRKKKYDRDEVNGESASLGGIKVFQVINSDLHTISFLFHNLRLNLSFQLEWRTIRSY